MAKGPAGAWVVDRSKRRRAQKGEMTAAERTAAGIKAAKTRGDKVGGKDKPKGKLLGMAGHLLSPMKEAARYLEAPHSAGQMNSLRRLAGQIDSTEGASDKMKKVSALSKEYIQAKSHVMTHEGRSWQHVRTDLRQHVQTFSNDKSAYEIRQPPNFKDKARSLESEGRKKYNTMADSYAGQRYEKNLRRDMAGLTKVHSDDLDQRAKMDEDHRWLASHHKRGALTADTPERAVAHKQVSSFHQRAADLQRAAAVHAAEDRSNPNRPVMIGKRGGRYVMTAGGKKWYIGTGG